MTMDARFDSWYVPSHAPIDPDKIFGSCSVTFNTYQVAIQACLETLGTTSAMIPVLMPVTSSPQTMAAVLRSGAHPALLDIREDTLQMDPDVVAEFLQQLEGGIVILNRPNGCAVDPRLLEVCAKHATIVDTRVVPSPGMPDDQIVGTFNVFDLGPLLGEGAMVITKPADLLAALRNAQSGLLGHSASLTQDQAHTLLQRTRSLALSTQYERRLKVVSEYNDILSEYGNHGSMLVNAGSFPHYYVLKCENVKRVVAYLHDFKVEAKHAVFGLHNVPNIRARYETIPEYPVVNALHNTLVALPLDPVRLVSTRRIIELVNEVRT